MRGEYGNRRSSVGASPKQPEAKSDSGPGVGTIALISVIAYGSGMLLMRSARKSSRQHTRDIHAINRPLSFA